LSFRRHLPQRHSIVPAAYFKPLRIQRKIYVLRHITLLTCIATSAHPLKLYDPLFRTPYLIHSLLGRLLLASSITAVLLMDVHFLKRPFQDQKVQQLGRKRRLLPFSRCNSWGHLRCCVERGMHVPQEQEYLYSLFARYLSLILTCTPWVSLGCTCACDHRELYERREELQRSSKNTDGCPPG